ncbi:The BTB (BR-C, ttk and bab)/POZ (Pox virus and Zinc finger) domain [Ceratobasidium sp. AG-Ba]|nr:The BTB (BR-C, ttk and bab)/POZ (Pox virus and Zinc finger) domain [Ceratobasidium sp. AG-Ba]
MPTKLTVIVSGTKFVLTQDQYKIDGPNYFTDAVAAHTGRFRGPRVKVSRNPEMFKVVLDYLNGYTILPKDGSLPNGITNRKIALKNLIAEAKFYRLNSLEAIAEEIWKKRSVGPSWHVMLSRATTSTDWGTPTHVSDDMMKTLQKKHGLSAHVVHTSGLSSSESKVLEKVGISFPFRIESAWEEASGNETIQVVVLTIVPDSSA